MKKLKKLGTLALCGLLLMSPCTVRADEAMTVITTDNVYVRPAPQSQEKLGIVSKGIKLTGVKLNSWFRFDFGGRTAYVASKYVAPTDDKGTNSSAGQQSGSKNEIEAYTGYTTVSLYVRPEKGAADYLGILPKGSKVVGLEDGAWLKINYDGKLAYIAKGLVSKSNSNGGDNSTEPNNSATFTGRTTTSLYIRPEKGAATSLGILASGQPVSGIVDGAWIRFNYKGKNAYIAKQYVREGTIAVKPGENNPSDNNQSGNNSQSGNNTGTSTGAKDQFFHGTTTCSLIVRPSKGSSERLGVLPKGTKIVAFDRGAWLEINYGGKSGFIAKKYVQADAGNASSGNTSSGSSTGTSSGNTSGNTASTGSYSGKLTCSLYVRPAKGSQEALGILPSNTAVRGEEDGSWLRIQYQGQTAYIALKYVSKTVASANTTVPGNTKLPGNPGESNGSSEDPKESHTLA